ncbi:MAG: hypothetical protein R3B97_13510 [Dehalococcoidia bacterium]|nr:hypothetical protein [Dehalococcoidia bacterium]
MHEYSALTACCWTTLSLDRSAIDRVQAEAVGAHNGGAVVTTCQRTEAYSAGPCDCGAPVHYRGLDALYHLAEVAGGVHSVVLGEAQILGQVRAGFSESGGRLAEAAEVALPAARALRRETDFNSHAGALLDRALSVAGLHDARSLLILGAGQLARLVAERARPLGLQTIVVSSRARPDWWAGPWHPFARLSAAPGADVIAGCLGSGANALASGDIPPAELLVDLGTPANFRSGQRAPVVDLAAMMADEQQRPHAVRRRAELAGRVRELVDARLAARATTRTSAVGMLRAEVERVRQSQVGRIQHLHPEIAPESIDAITRALLNQVFHGPSERLKAGDPAFGRQVAGLFAP